MESKILDLLKVMLGFGLNKDEVIKADPWTPWPFP